MTKKKHIHRHALAKIHPAAGAGLPGGAAAGPGGELPGVPAAVPSGGLPVNADADAQSFNAAADDSSDAV